MRKVPPPTSKRETTSIGLAPSRSPQSRNTGAPPRGRLAAAAISDTKYSVHNSARHDRSRVVFRNSSPRRGPFGERKGGERSGAVARDDAEAEIDDLVEERLAGDALHQDLGG